VTQALRFEAFEVERGDALALGAQLALAGLATLRLQDDVAEDLRAAASRLGPVYAHRDADGLGFTWIEARRGEDLALGDLGFSEGKLAVHTETSGSPRPPELVALACVRPALDGGECLLADGRAIARGIRRDAEAWASLCDPKAARFRSGSEEWTGSVLEAGHGYARWRFRSDALAEWSPAARKVLPRLMEQIDKNTVQLTLRAGDAIVANNGWWLHGRHGFTGPRRLVRVLVGAGPEMEIARDLRGFPLDGA
jgi:Taurine catabolism dioxygenase TauD, TfdA family